MRTNARTRPERRATDLGVRPAGRAVGLLLVLTLMIASSGHGAEPAEPLLRDLPPGLFVDRSEEIPATQAHAVGEKLGGRIHRLTNSIVRVHGRSLQVNVLTAEDEANAEALLAALQKMKSYPFCLRQGVRVVEYVGRNIDAALAIKTSFELGLRDKPQRVHYRVTAEMATVDKADDRACTPLLNRFVELENDPNPQTRRAIHDLVEGFTFGHTLTLRDPALEGGSTRQTFRPSPVGSRIHGPVVTWTFADLERREGVPFVQAILDIDVDATDLCESDGDAGKQSIAATSFWPAEDPRVTTLAQQIVANESTNDQKAMAILEWLTPGRNLEYSGDIGSRWGTLQVLEQGFGRCWDFSDCFVTLSRAAGVPCRQVAGWLYGGSGHVWAEYLSDSGSWRQVDPTGGGTLRCGIYHIPWFTSEDGAMPILYVSPPHIEMISATDEGEPGGEE